MGIIGYSVILICNILVMYLFLIFVIWEYNGIKIDKNFLGKYVGGFVNVLFLNIIYF